MTNMVRLGVTWTLAGALLGGCGSPEPHSDRGLGGARPVERERQELRTLQREGEALLDAGEVELASARFERVLKRLPGFPSAVDDGSLRGRAEERLSAARAVLEWPPVEQRSARAEPTHPDFLEGTRHYEAFDYAKAAACFRRASEAEPQDEVIRHYWLQAELLAGEREAEFEPLVLPSGRLQPLPQEGSLFAGE